MWNRLHPPSLHIALFVKGHSDRASCSVLTGCFPGRLFVTAFTLALTACFEAANPGEFWARGRPDPDFIGLWKDDKGHPALTISKSEDSLRIQFFDDAGKPEPTEKDLYARSIMVKGQRFLLTVPPVSRTAVTPRAGIYPCTLQADTAALYILTRKGGEELVQRMNGKGVRVTGATFYSVEVDILKEEHLAALATMVQDERFFTISRLKRAPGSTSQGP